MLLIVLKKAFHRIRDYIRYLREYDAIREVKRLLPQHHVFCFYGHFGEAYMASAIWQCLENKDNVVVLLVREQAYVRSIFELFSDKKVIKIVNNRARNCIIHKFRNEANFLDWNIYTELQQKNKSANMMSAFKKLGNIPLGTCIKPVLYENKNKELMMVNLLKKINATLKKTVLIFPEAETVVLLKETQKFWLLLADKLKQAGFSVVFNSKNTFGSYQSVFLPVAETICLAQLCGYALGKRNGLLDVLAGTTDVIIEAIYPVFTKKNKENYDFCAQYFYFFDEKSMEENYLASASLKGIRNDNKIIEVIWQADSEEFLNLLVSNIINSYNLSK